MLSRRPITGNTPRLLADLEETEQAVSDMHAAPRGELRVNAFGILQLAPAIADFTARFRAISVELMLSIRIADLIDEGFDVAVWVGEPPDSTLVARQLAPCRMVVGFGALIPAPRPRAWRGGRDCAQGTPARFGLIIASAAWVTYARSAR